MKMSVKCFCGLLAEARDEETVSTKEVNPYLLDQVLRPTLRENAPMLKDINYEELDEEDIATLGRYYGSMCKIAQRLEQFSKAISSVEPVPCRTRQFC